MVENHRSSTPKQSTDSNARDQLDQSETPKEPDIDQDLEAYLRTMSEEKGAADEDEPDGQESEEAADLDEYLNELDAESNGSHENDDVDSEEYLHVADQSSEEHQ